MQAADLRPIPDAEKNQSPVDLFLIFAGANIVATTFQVGASLAGSFTVGAAVTLIIVGSIAGAGLRTEVSVDATGAMGDPD